MQHFDSSSPQEIVGRICHMIRPEWRADSVTRVVESFWGSHDPKVILAAFAAAAADKTIRTPGVVDDPRAFLARLVAAQAPSTPRARMRCLVHDWHDTKSCPECAEEKAAAKDRRESGEQRAIAAKHLATIRADLKRARRSRIIPEPTKKQTEPAQESTQPTNPTPTHTQQAQPLTDTTQAA